MSNPNVSSGTEPPAALQEVVDELKPLYPEVFTHQAEKAAAMIEQLDNDPEQALSDPDTRLFVGCLTEQGFVRDYWEAATQLNKAADPERCRASLPVWLQPEFLDDHGIQLLPSKQKGYSPKAIETEYAAFLEQNDLTGSVREGTGDHYIIDEQYQPPAVPLLSRYKLYIERESLGAALADGSFQSVYNALTSQRIAPQEVKLFDQERLVLNFASSINADAPVVEAILQHYKVPYRGPAQDVARVLANIGQPLQLTLYESNDNALHDKPIGWNVATPQPYNPSTFLKAYLTQCAKWGKSPENPYVTSFITMLMSEDDPSRQDSAVLREAEALAAPYPVVVQPFPYDEVSVPIMDWSSLVEKNEDAVQAELVKPLDFLHYPPTAAMKVLEQVAPILMQPERRDGITGFEDHVLKPLIDRPEYQQGIDSVSFNDILVDLSARGSGWTEEYTYEPEHSYLKPHVITGIGNPAEPGIEQPNDTLRAGFAGQSNEFVMYALDANREPVFVSIWQPATSRNIFSGKVVGTWRKEGEGISGIREGFSSADEALDYLKRQAALPPEVTWQHLHIPLEPASRNSSLRFRR